jgi:soluble lytic murein transglycosylase
MTPRRLLPLMAALTAGLLAAGVVRAEPPVLKASTGSSLAKGTAATPPAAAAPKPEVPATPAPRRNAAEARYFAEMDRLIATVRDTTPSADDLKRLEAVTQLLARRDTEKAIQTIAEITDPVSRKFAHWFRMRSGQAEPREIRAFLAENPGWPDADAMIARLEEKLLADPPRLADVRAAFPNAEPQTAAGFAALARVHLATGDTERARGFARRAWTDPELSSAEEALVVQHLGSLLSPVDHRLRLDRLLIDDERWTKDRNERAVVVRRLLPLLDDGERKKAEARLAVFLRSKNARALLDALPKEQTTDYGLLFQRIQNARRADRDEEAWRLMLSVPPAAPSIVNPDGWWFERRAVAYAALDSGQAKIAYDIVREAGAISVNPRKEQTFLAGWLALRYLKDARAAARHFEDMRKAADGPLSRAKAEYWSGRTAEALGDAARAREHFTAAQRFPDTFHGQLALARTGAARTSFAFPPPALPNAAQVRAFETSDAVRAAVAAHKAGLVGPARTFLFHLARGEQGSEPQAAMLAHLAEALGDTQAAVRIGKAAIARGHNLVVYAYPTHPMPAYKPLRQPPEPAFLLAIARQESEFNRTIVSGAGARGLLQVMPITAKHVCRDYKIKCEIPRLLTDNAYNAMIASAYIADRKEEFSGSYVLALAGYNAGPGRARQWIRRFGDPRDPAVDPIDWIERIPFEETREYVGKVLSNIQVYRARLGEDGGLRIAADLMRARRTTTAGEGGERPTRAAAQ